MVKIFELEVSTWKMASQLGVSYKTASKAVTLLRLAILSKAKDGEKLLGREVELGEFYFGGKRKGMRGRGAAGKVPVFGISERAGRVWVKEVPDVHRGDALGSHGQDRPQGKHRLHRPIQVL